MGVPKRRSSRHPSRLTGTVPSTTPRCAGTEVLHRSSAFAIVEQHPRDAEGAGYHCLLTGFAPPLQVHQGAGTLGYQTVATEAPSHAPVERQQILSAGFLQIHWQGNSSGYCNETSSSFFQPSSSSPASSKHLFLLLPLYQPRGHCNSANRQINLTKANPSTEPCTTREKDSSAKEARLWSQEEKQDRPAGY